MLMAKENGRTAIGAPDKLFGVSARAKERIAEKGRDKVIDSTIGVLLDDDGKLVVLESVMECVRRLKPEDYAAYAPILGLPAYRQAVKKAVFMNEIPEGVFVEACYTPGGTGAIRNAVSAYTAPGDQILVSDWHWNPYNLIASEIGRRVAAYPLFIDDAADGARDGAADDVGHGPGKGPGGSKGDNPADGPGSGTSFDAAAFSEALSQVLAEQDQTLVIINTPAHNPTGYTFTDEDWDQVLEALARFPEKKIALLADIAYLDFAGDAVCYRTFLKKLAKAPGHVLPLIAFSASKGYTMYGMRCGAICCMAQNRETADEFLDVMSVESRATWSNGNRAAMQVLADILSDEECLAKVKAEREHYLRLLRRRGAAFMEEAAKAELSVCPYDSGFFITIPCEDPEAAGRRLQEMDVFVIPMGRGLRVSVASNTEAECRIMPAKIKEAITSLQAL